MVGQSQRGQQRVSPVVVACGAISAPGEDFLGRLHSKEPHSEGEAAQESVALSAGTSFTQEASSTHAKWLRHWIKLRACDVRRAANDHMMGGPLM